MYIGVSLISSQTEMVSTHSKGWRLFIHLTSLVWIRVALIPPKTEK